MKYTVISVRDSAADAYGRPMFTATIGQGIRSFMDEIQRAAPDNVMHQHPEDFDLYHLGHFNEDNGLFENLPDGPHRIAVGKQLKGNGHA